MHEKTCTKCKITKDLTFFNKRKTSRDGYRKQCKACRSDYFKNYYELNRSKVRENHAKYYLSHSEVIKANSKKYRESNPEQMTIWRSVNVEWIKETRKAYYKSHKAEEIANNRKRYNRISKATPDWLTEAHWKKMNDMYANCPEGWHVDHIVPLNNPIVCGLHVPWNLQYLPAKENLAKGNKLDWPAADISSYREAA